MGKGIRMTGRASAAGSAVLLLAAAGHAQQQTGSYFDRPLNLSLQPAEPESVYAPPAPPREDEGINQGAVHFELGIAYFTDYVFRGIERFGEGLNPDEERGQEDRANLQINAKLSWDLGKLPHPFIATFVNVAESDPVSTFEEVRPVVGVDWAIRPLLLSGGHTAYIFPDRDDIETSEFWGRIQIDDSFFLHTEEPVFSPYVFGAYDYDLYNGWYIEGGVSHKFSIEDTGLTLTAEASVAYVNGIELFNDLHAVAADENVNGLQHYQVGLVADYSLNNLLNVSTRYGAWSLQGYLYYTDGIDDKLRADTQLWGGAGILFRY